MFGQREVRNTGTTDHTNYNYSPMVRGERAFEVIFYYSLIRVIVNI